MKQLNVTMTEDGRIIIHLNEDDTVEVVTENGVTKAFFDHYEEPDHAGWADRD